MQKSAQFWICVLISLIGGAAGCRFDSADRVHTVPFFQANNNSGVSGASQIENAKTLLRDGCRLDGDQDAGCIAQYLCAAQTIWPVVASEAVSNDLENSSAAKIYNQCLRRIIDSGQEYGLFQPQTGQFLPSPSSGEWIPILYRGFPWDPQDFDLVIPAATEVSKKLNHDYRCNGLGVPVVVINKRLEGERFLRDQQAFAATLVLREARPDEGLSCGFVFEFIDPLRVRSVNVGGCEVAVARDLSAPIAYRISKRDKNYLEGFLQPGTTD
ncbi:MAG: hypothetical protein ACPHO8_07785, partial [Mariniblastus sp.]